MSIAPLEELRAAVRAAATDLRGEDGAFEPTLERPKKAEFGDYSTNAAMLLAPALGQPPRAIAQTLGERLSERLGGAVDRVDVAGPGFLNVFLTDGWYAHALEEVLQAGDAYGAVPAETPERIIVEFVSANPTGPLTAAGGRHAAFGDALARLLELRGNDVEREYYVNDFGGQVRRLGESVLARARGEEPPEDGYAGEYVKDLAARIPDAAERDPDDLAQAAVELLLESIKRSLANFRVEFDTWFSERSLHEGAPTPVQEAFERVRAAGHAYESEGALWLRTTALGDDKDRVLRKADGETTYFASDLAYLLSKQDRGAQRQINVLGADHHGYIGRMKAAFASTDLDPATLEILIMQFVNIVERGEKTSMSKRRGEFVTLDDLVADIGADAARFLMLMRSHDTMVDLDLDVAREQSDKNPVFYVQYAHARIASIRRRASGEPSPELPQGAELHPSERSLIKRLLAFPGECTEAADRRAPHRIAVYATELAQEFAAFYRDCKVVGSDLEGFRLAECAAAQAVLARALGLLGVGAPESM